MNCPDCKHTEMIEFKKYEGDFKGLENILLENSFFECHKCGIKIEEDC